MNEPGEALMRFNDGPLHGVGNIRNVGGGYDFIVPTSVYGWPLPERLRVLAHPGHADQVAMWDPEDQDHGLPDTLVNSPNAVTYRKVSESRLPEKVNEARVVRGAVYALEEA